MGQLMGSIARIASSEAPSRADDAEIQAGVMNLMEVSYEPSIQSIWESHIIETDDAYTIAFFESVDIESADKPPNERSSLSCGKAALGVTAVDIQL